MLPINYFYPSINVQIITVSHSICQVKKIPIHEKQIDKTSPLPVDRSRLMMSFSKSTAPVTSPLAKVTKPESVTYGSLGIVVE
jgi:hypothetical protein